MSQSAIVNPRLGGYIPGLMTQTFLALLHYDGTDFVGWQRQPEGRSVQGEFEAVLERISGERVVAHAAGRTDAGVHALGLGVSFAAPARWSADALRRALNGLLPRDCWIEAVKPMKPGFHARKSASERRYRYDVGTDAASFSPFRRPYEWALGRALDPALLAAASRTLLGTHDFRAFSAKTAGKPHYNCTIRRAAWEARADDRGYSLHVAADRFLHHMVRFLVGTMVDIGLGRRPLSDMARLLARTDNEETSPPAPPQGLYFVGVEYPADCHQEEPQDVDAAERVTVEGKA